MVIKIIAFAAIFIILFLIEFAVWMIKDEYTEDITIFIFINFFICAFAALQIFSWIN